MSLSNFLMEINPKVREEYIKRINSSWWNFFNITWKTIQIDSNWEKDKELLEELLNNGVDINVRTIKQGMEGFNILHYACELTSVSQQQAIKFLINKGADYNNYFRYSVRYAKITPLHYACILKNDVAVQALLEHYNDLKQIVGANSDNALHLAVLFNLFSKDSNLALPVAAVVNIISLLTNKDKDIINSVNGDGNTALHLALNNKPIDSTIIAPLLGAGANLFQKNNENYSPWDMLVNERESKVNNGVRLIKGINRVLKEKIEDTLYQEYKKSIIKVYEKYNVFLPIELFDTTKDSLKALAKNRLIADNKEFESDFTALNTLTRRLKSLGKEINDKRINTINSELEIKPTEHAGQLVSLAEPEKVVLTGPQPDNPSECCLGLM